MTDILRQQIREKLNGAENVLICFKEIKYGSGYPAGGDAVASALALARILEKDGKNVHIASPNFNLPAHFAFLSGAEKITNRAPADDYDLIIVLDTAQLAQLGDLYDENIFSAPIVNLDTSPENERYGEINWTDPQHSSVAEMIFNLFRDDDIMPEIADYFLAGIIAKTKNFRKAGVHYETLAVAGDLLAQGARHHHITDNFYRTKNLETLQFWGRLLSKLATDGDILWAAIPFGDCDADCEHALHGAMHELIANSPEAKIFAIIFEKSVGQPEALIYSDKFAMQIPAMGLAHQTGQLTHLHLPRQTLAEATINLISELKKSPYRDFSDSLR
jgi:hypothetical protein